jgi:hypothetical protein
MSAGHRHHPAGHPIDQTRERELQTLMAQPWFEAAVRAYTIEDCDHDVPYAGGSLTDWRTVVWDRHLCAAIQQGRFLLRGNAIDPRRSGKVHEAIEGAIIHLWERVRQLLGWPEHAHKYLTAHDIGNIAERHAAEHLGWPWDPYQAAWKPFIRLEKHEAIVRPPSNLLMDAYEGTPIYAHLLKFQRKLTHEQAGYHQGPGAEGSHCAVCANFIIAAPPDCTKVVPPIAPNDGCDMFEARKGKAQVRGKNAEAVH